MIKINIKSQDSKTYLRILDNGGGIYNDDVNQIFEPYYTTKFEKKGAGIGLYMSKMLVENSMGGKLLSKNISGGACFGIEIACETDNAR